MYLPANAAPHLTPKIDDTKANSKTVGTILNTIAVRTKLIPLEPLSIVFDRAPEKKNNYDHNKYCLFITQYYLPVCRPK